MIQKLSALIIMLVSSITMYAIDYNTPIGWASVDGTTIGGNDENPVVVSTLSELTTALKTARNNTKQDDQQKMTIYIKGEIETSGYISLQDTKNLTIYGLPGSTFINNNRNDKSLTGILLMKRCENIILRNLTFRSAGAYDIDGNDNLTLQSSNHIWVDHCDFQDGVDGNFDCNNQATNVTVSWCRFRYLIAPKSGGSGGSNDHRFSNLWGGSDTAADDGYLNTTFVCCWWDEGCRERMPRVRFGRVHMLNCLYSSSVTSYAIGVGYKSRICVDNSVFSFTVNSSHKVWKYASTSGQNDHSYQFRNCQGIADTKHNAVEDYFNPDDIYSYDIMPSDEVEETLTDEENGAGATLNIKEGEPFTTSIENATANGNKNSVKTIYHNMSGQKVTNASKGLFIQTEVMEDGSMRKKKILVP
ncbi:MAG: chromophore lyase [Prevotella sp.]|nr:chromophore lyase [Prevotella sp.]